MYIYFITSSSTRMQLGKLFIKCMQIVLILCNFYSTHKTNNTQANTENLVWLSLSRLIKKKRTTYLAYKFALL